MQATSPAPPRLLYAATVALSAFLLFSVEPMVTKALLPLLGGSSAVWVTALAFFQLALLLGYGYTVFLTRTSSPGHGRLLGHLALMLCAVIVLVIPGFSGFAKFGADLSLPPQLELFALLTTAIGLPFFVLTTTAPLLQAWYAQRERAAVPYRLFALSNFGSLLALLAYPLLIEPHLTLGRQTLLWRLGFLLYAVLMLAIADRVWRDRGGPLTQSKRPVSPALADAPPAAEPKTQREIRLLWFALPAVASVQLVAVTEHLTQNVAAMPLLWVLPLAAYLLSFVLAFEFPALYRRGVMLRVAAVLLFSLGYFLAQTEVNIPIGLSIGFFAAELLAACWLLHAELYALRPHEASATTIFYFVVAAGGAAGTIAVAVLSPLLTSSNYDLPVSFVLTAAVILAVTWPAGSPVRLFWAGATGLGVVLLVALHNDYSHDALLRARNFYGSVRVTQTDLPPQAFTSRILYNGSIQHGMQWFSDEFKDVPLTYYARDSGIGLALDNCCANRARRIGVIGLGAGTLAAYGRPGDTIQFYEINPLVTTIATQLFTYTRDTPATVAIIPGDARLSLASEPPQNLDVLVVDAFSGDSIPVHLLTREALDLYRRHLAPGGIIAFHISNQFLDLAPVLARLAESTKAGANPPLFARRLDTDANDERGERRASWVLMTDQPQLFSASAFAFSRPVKTLSDVSLWTDQYSSLLPIVRWSGRD